MNSADYADALTTLADAQAWAREVLAGVLASHADAGIIADALITPAPGSPVEFASTAGSVSSLVDLLLGRGVAVVTSARWQDLSGDWHDLTTPTGNSFGARLAAALVKYRSDCLLNARLLSDDIDAAITIDEVLQVDLSTGWPSRSVSDPASGLAPAYDVGTFISGKPTGSEVVLRLVASRVFTLAASLVGSRGNAGTAATSQTDFDVKKGGSSVGTVRFAASGTVASFIAASATSFAVGDVLSVVAPASADATLADISITLLGMRA